MTKESIKFAFKEAIVSLVATIIICGILNVFSVKDGCGLAALAAETPIAILITGALCCTLQFFMRKGAVKKGAVPPMGDINTQVAYALIPKNNIVFVLAVAVIDFLLFVCVPVGILTIVAPEIYFARFVNIALRSVLSGFAAGYATFHGIVFFCAKFQANQVKA
ncbi:MAG: hypothetical protein IJ306_09350 [Oscillospiraceae bacterium]|nr:hypothetical protein [Oscillospiraceae bacterium]